jgi:hypothetical protein
MDDIALLVQFVPCQGLTPTLSICSYVPLSALLWMTPGASLDLLLKDPEGLFVDPFSGTDGNKFYLPRVFDSIDDSKRTDSKTFQP